MKAFTLVELLVVITIIVVLLALLTPAMDKAIESATRVICQANTRAWAQTSLHYALDHKKHLPIGKPEGVDSVSNPYKTDHLGQFRYSTFVTLRDEYGLPEAAGFCRSIGRLPPFFKPYNGGGLADPRDNMVFSTFTGWAYWGNRKPLPGDPFVFPTTLTARSTAPTLVTCLAYDDPRFVSYAPHAQGEGRVVTKGGSFTPEPDGLAVAYTDGSDHWVDWKELEVLQTGVARFFYDGPKTQ